MAVDGDRLQLDAWALTDFAAWLYAQMPDAKPKQFCDRFLGYFPDSCDLMDVLISYVVAAPAPARPPQGDETYYVARARVSEGRICRMGALWLK